MLKYLQIVIFSLLGFGLFAQVQDDFTDGDFTTNPTWAGDDSKFIVNGANELQLMAPAETSDAYLSTPSESIENATWEFYVRLGFNPSSTNYARVYLTSSSPNLRESLNGYFVYIGGTADEISLFRQTGTSRTRIINGIGGSVNSSVVNAKIRVTRDIGGNWELLRDTSLTDIFISEGTAFDNTHIQSSYFGVYCDYTATRSELFFYDDFNVIGDPYIDTDPPLYQSLIVTSSNTLSLLFNESLAATSVETVTNYAVNNGIGNPINAELAIDNDHQINLTFGSNFVDGATHEINITNIDDVAGNTMTSATDEFFFYIANIPETGEVRINEVMAKENPSVGLPLTEYIELYNPTSKSFDLTGWKICNDNSCGTIQNALLLPGAYIIIVPTGGLSLFSDVQVINATSFPTLKNNGDEVILWYLDENIKVDEMTYTLETYQDEIKKEGGYSLELINPELPCSGQSNWTATNSVIGGTPGSQNSVYDTTPDTTPPSIESIYALSTNSIQVTFSELMDSVDLVSINVTISPAVTVVDLLCLNRYSYTVDILVGNDLTPSTIYTVTLTDVEDCSGNSTNLVAEVILPSEPTSGELIINEILFNPLTGGSDYVELYNNSGKVFNLKNWHMANFTDTIANLRLISDDHLLFYPNSYLVLTTDSVNVKQNYLNHGYGTFAYCNLPSYPNSSGSVLVINQDNIVVDRVDYQESWHFRLIDDKKGKSLERISASGFSNESSNWQTASETIGFGTPGLKNSQNFEADIDGSFTIDPKVFSPDNDGYQDFAIFSYDLPEPGMMGSIYIFDENGRQVREFVNNHYFDQRGELKWDGLRDDGSKCAVGRYIVLVDIFSPAGTVKRINQRSVVIIASRL